MTELERIAPRLAQAHAARQQEIAEIQARREALRRGFAQIGKNAREVGAAYKQSFQAIERATKSIGELFAPQR